MFHYIFSVRRNPNTDTSDYQGLGTPDPHPTGHSLFKLGKAPRTNAPGTNAPGTNAPRTNAEADGRLLEEVAAPDAEGRRLLTEAAERMKLTARGYHRVLKVARTLADLD